MSQDQLVRMIWCAVQCHGSFERFANRALRSIGLYTFYPVERLTRYRGRGFRRITETIERAYYPRYLFALMNPDRDWPRINRAFGVVRVLAYGGAPIAIPGDAMRLIMTGADERGVMGSRDLVSRKRFEAASKVKFRPGSPFVGFVAEVVRDDGGTRDVQMLLSIFGAPTHVSAPASSLVAA